MMTRSRADACELSSTIKTRQMEQSYSSIALPLNKNFLR